MQIDLAPIPSSLKFHILLRKLQYLAKLLASDEDTQVPHLGSCSQQRTEWNLLTVCLNHCAVQPLVIGAPLDD